MTNVYDGEKDEQKITKAHLVARGFEENTDAIKTDSPTVTRQSLRMIMTVASSKEWKVQSMDISAAFLQGSKIEREI